MTGYIDPRDIDLSKLLPIGSTAESVEVPFELKAKDFLNFANDDIRGRSLRDTVNALSNIKRSIDCLFDSLLFAVNFLEESKCGRWTFPEKMNFLGEIGTIAPHIIHKINSARNMLEHEFKKPIRKEVETAYDVALLLYHATVRFTKIFVDGMGFSTKDEKWKIDVEVNRVERKIGITTDSQSITVAWDKSPEDYKKWLHLIYQAQYLGL